MLQRPEQHQRRLQKKNCTNERIQGRTILTAEELYLHQKYSFAKSDQFELSFEQLDKSELRY